MTSRKTPRRARRRRRTRPCPPTVVRPPPPSAARRRRGRRAPVARQARRGRLLDHLLVAALQRAVALAERDHAAAAVAEDLHLDVAGRAHEALDVDAGPATRWRSRRRTAGHASRSASSVWHARMPMPPPPPVAFSITGYPRAAAALSASSRARASALPGSSGTPTAAASRGPRPWRRRRAAAPRSARRSRGRGLDAAATAASSESNPYPGCIAPAPVGTRGVEDAVDPQVALARRRRADRHRLIGHRDVRRAPVGVGVDGDRAQPSAAADRRIRQAISPRFATSSVSNGTGSLTSGSGRESKRFGAKHTPRPARGKPTSCGRRSLAGPPAGAGRGERRRWR